MFQFLCIKHCSYWCWSTFQFWL